ncbi:hypothetical protein FIBSPDRAFT_937357 [Athelia psychrophila]|uniref:Uncharacterized protein n=1 Tax=Athelia psychrophila TaxID=1759441 RepID=A0A166AMF8_9AGAM|nr:hypothetical protein FIBSPDRAFT_937357 [Fibularhizoctonia sp. CBS 109695]
MQFFTLTATVPPRLALILALLSYSASAAPHPHTKRCNTELYRGGCYAATDCCAFSYCQAMIQDDGTAFGSCFPGFSETPYMKIVTPSTAASEPATPTGWHAEGPGERRLKWVVWWDFE